MDCFDFDNVKAEKAKAMHRYRRLRKIANLFRCVEVCIALVLLSWFSTRLPIAVKISGEYFRELCLVLVSPRFVFLAGNAIILTLFAKSGQFSALGGFSTSDDLYDEFVKNNTDDTQSRQKPPRGVDDDDSSVVPAPAPPEEEELIFFEDNKETTVVRQEELVFTNAYREEVEEKKKVASSSDSKMIFRRSQSENLKTKKLESEEEEAKKKPHRELKRSETEKCLMMVGSDAAEIAAVASYAEDNLSNEEFQRTVEAFIARHQQFLREEESSMAIVLQN